MRKPNFFIVGAPRCGTTALSQYLGTHPRVFLSRPKELFYFAEDCGDYRNVQTLDDYMDSFRRSNDTHLAVGEASTWYLRSPVAIDNIYAFNAAARIIVMLRHPIDLVQSWHTHLVYRGHENQTHLETAWRLQSSRRNGNDIPRTCRVASFLQYADVARLGEQLEKVFAVFGRDQTKVILLEDFARSTRVVYEDVLAFLGVPSDGRSEFPRANERKEHRVAWVGKLMRDPPLPLSVLMRSTKSVLRSFGIRGTGIYRALLTKRQEPKPLSVGFRDQLINEFKQDVAKLSDLLGTDLEQRWGFAAECANS